ncbi:vacuolar ATP synthase subunit H [Cavenderia fasciculata]|uniref:V-type proton ATPase subunit H n=1 Tax=Cavenderia fasciculata TaxID=261658 RepID=F4PWF3_CACFS|nr:vacuolar ATP synthase subunit H [Cavenderia fasciculata]EGG20317.1 vacuolar ATP synthase subunit H [Cavenderia fasciculata]|eukprot:XP_004367300.1 vacuolar ATP synthase subunit H [Cavenderia fasciculata]
MTKNFLDEKSWCREEGGGKVKTKTEMNDDDQSQIIMNDRFIHCTKMRFDELADTSNGVKAAEAAFREKVLARQVPWNAFFNSNGMSEQECDLITKYDKKPEAEKREKFLANGEKLTHFFVNFIHMNANYEIIQYLLTLINEIIHIEPKSLQFFAKLKKDDDPSYPYSTFFRLLSREDNNAYINLLTGVILGNIMSAGTPQQKDIEYLFNWILPLLRKNNAPEVEVGLIALQPLLTREEHRVIFHNLQGQDLLINILAQQVAAPTPNLTLLYETLYVLWLFSYNSSVATSLSGKGVVGKLVTIIKQIQKDKIVRLSIATLKNLMGKGNNNEEMIECGFIRMLNFLSNKKWGDEDIVTDLTDLSTGLSEDIAIMSSFDKYKAEVLSNELEWTPVHKSEQFWKDNASKFEENNFNVLKFLHLILQKSSNPLHLSVACHDLGEFVIHHPRGKHIVEQLQIKPDIMSLMANTNEEVKKHALFALQKMMINNWEYLSAK